MTKFKSSVVKKKERPRKTRLRKQSKFVNPEENSTISCGICGKKGHNQLDDVQMKKRSWGRE